MRFRGLRLGLLRGVIGALDPSGDQPSAPDHDDPGRRISLHRREVVPGSAVSPGIQSPGWSGGANAWQVWNLPDFPQAHSWRQGYATLHSPLLYLRIGHAAFCLLAAFAGGEAARYLHARRSDARLVEPTALVSLSCIEELSRTERSTDGTLRIGAMTRHRDVAEMPALMGTHALLRQAAAAIANPTIRAMGTIGGSIALNDPGADYAPALFPCRPRLKL